VGPCLKQQELIVEAQSCLAQLSELMRAAAAALENRHENLAHEIDLQIELKFGEKERAMGKLQQHREEHGC